MAKLFEVTGKAHDTIDPVAVSFNVEQSQAEWMGEGQTRVISTKRTSRGREYGNVEKGDVVAVCSGEPTGNSTFDDACRMIREVVRQSDKPDNLGVINDG